MNTDDEKFANAVLDLAAKLPTPPEEVELAEEEFANEEEEYVEEDAEKKAAGF